MRPEAGPAARVLVVDDSDESRAAIAAAARAAGFELVAAAASGEEALSVLERAAPDLVLLDVRMGGLDGLETCRLIGELDRRTVVVLVSAFSREELPGQAASCGAAGFLDKREVSPSRLAALWQTLRETAV